MTPHRPTRETRPDPSSAHVPLTPDAIRSYVQDWLRRAADNPEGAGYADFRTAGRPRTVELYSAPRDRFFATIEIDRHLTPVDRSDVERALRDLVPPDQIDTIGHKWQVRFYAADHFPDALFHVLRDLCRIPEREHLSIDDWWS